MNCPHGKPISKYEESNLATRELERSCTIETNIEYREQLQQALEAELRKLEEIGVK